MAQKHCDISKLHFSLDFSALQAAIFLVFIIISIIGLSYVTTLLPRLLQFFYAKGTTTRYYIVHTTQQCSKNGKKCNEKCVYEWLHDFSLYGKYRGFFMLHFFQIRKEWSTKNRTQTKLGYI